MKKKVVLFLTLILVFTNILSVNAAYYNTALEGTTLKESIAVMNGSEAGSALGNDIYLNDCKNASFSYEKVDINIDNPGQTKWLKITPTSDVYCYIRHSSVSKPSECLLLYCYDATSGKANIVDVNYHTGERSDNETLSVILQAGKTYFLGSCFKGSNINAKGTISFDITYTNLVPSENIKYDEHKTNLKGINIFRFTPTKSSEYFMYYRLDYMNCNVFDSNGNLVHESNYIANPNNEESHSYFYVGYRLSANQTYIITMFGDNDFKITDLKAQKVSLNVSKITIKKGTKYTWLKAKLTPSFVTDKTLSWTSSNKKVATVDSNGIIKGKSSGEATITVKSSNGKKAKVNVTVTDNNVEVAKIVLNEKDKTVRVGDKITLTASVSPVNATNNKVTWKSSNKKVAKVNSKGEVTMVGSGMATITCIANDRSGKSASFKITDAKPDKVNLTSVKSKWKKNVTLSWKYPDRTFGYEIYRSTSKNGIYELVNEINEKDSSEIINGKNMMWIGLDGDSGTTYYYKIRAYVTISDKKVFGKYSSIKSVKIK